MDDELGYYYISKHFERHTQRPEKRPHILIVDSHSSHICWPVIQHVLNHDTHVIQLPSKSTHFLQPLDVGCFALLQAAYERHLQAWLLDNPLSVIRKVDFLGLLYKAQKDTFEPDIIRKAWKSAHCWPIDLDLARDMPAMPVPVPLVPKLESDDQKQTSADHATTLSADAPLVIRKLASDAEQAIFNKGKGKGKGKANDVPVARELFHSVTDTAVAKLTHCHDIALQATTINKLRNGKVCKKKVG